MKFCKNLQRVLDISDPEWAPYWPNYKMLKKLIKELPSLVPPEEPTKRPIIAPSDSSESSIECHKKAGMHFATEKKSTVKTVDHCSNNRIPTEQPPKNITYTGSRKGSISSLDGNDKSIFQNGNRTLDKIKPSALSPSDRISQNVKAMNRSPGEITFFKLLHSELNKACRFFQNAEQEFSLREERIREGKEIMQKSNSIMVRDRWSLLSKSLYNLYKDLLLLETFAIMTYCSFSKILKKHDKMTGFGTRNAFMANVVNKANFTNYPGLLAMINRTETLYEEVSAHLVEEGKYSLFEDERLFINMIHRLNQQTLLGECARKDARKRSSLNTAASITLTPKNNAAVHNTFSAESKTYKLKSLVEENEAEVLPSGINDDASEIKRDASSLEEINDANNGNSGAPINEESGKRQRVE